MLSQGGLIAAFLTPKAIYLASDGRVVDARGGQVHDDWPKLYSITGHAGMLTTGAYIPDLKEEMVRQCLSENASRVGDVAQVARIVLQDIWKLNAARSRKAGTLREFRILAFVVGFEEKDSPRLFSLRNTSHPSFIIKEQKLFQSGNDLEVVSMVADGRRMQDLSVPLGAHVSARQQTGYDLSEAFPPPAVVPSL